MTYIKGSINGARRGLRRASTKPTMVASFDSVADAGNEWDDSFSLSASRRGESKGSVSIRSSNTDNSLMSSYALSTPATAACTRLRNA